MAGRMADAPVVHERIGPNGRIRPPPMVARAPSSTPPPSSQRAARVADAGGAMADRMADRRMRRALRRAGHGTVKASGNASNGLWVERSLWQNM